MAVMEHDLVLAGPVVTLHPVRGDEAAEYAELTRASPSWPEELRWHTSPPPVDEHLAAEALAEMLADPGLVGFAVRGTGAGELRGVTSFYDHVPAVPRVEVGHTHYGRPFWGGPTNPAAKLLLLTHAFEEWGCRRVALRCDAENTRSMGAIRRLGAAPEGVLRRHRRRHDGTVADTAYFSVTDAEWPVVRAGLRARVSP
jgi:N-acetyltransferase